MNYYAIDTNRYYLSHHGIKGQKWGKRNYQYEDGSYTPAGRERYGIGPRGSASNLMRSNNAYGRHVGRVVTQAGRPFHSLVRGTKNYVRSVRNTHGIKKIATLQGYQTREAQRANAANARDEARISRQIGDSYKGKGLYSRYARNSHYRMSDAYSANAKGHDAYANSRDRGKSILKSYSTKYKTILSSPMRSISGKESTVGKEVIKSMLYTAGSAAIGIAINRKYQEQ